MKILADLFEELFKLLFSSVGTLFRIFFPKEKIGYDASFMSGSKMLKRRNTGWCLTGFSSLNEKLSFNNALIVGPTGSGKSTKVIIPSILKMKGSMVINDPSSEIKNLISGYLLRILKVKVLVLDFKNAKNSFGYNPLHYAKTVGEINQLAQTLIKASLTKSNDPFWELSATSFLAVIIRFLKFQEKKHQTLANVLHVVNTIGTDPKVLDVKFAELPDQELFNEYAAFTAYDSKVKQSIIATTKAALAFVTDPAIQNVTNRNDFKFKNLRKERTIVFINNKVSDADLYAPLVSVLYTQLFSFIMSEIPDPKKSESIWLIIDEASSLTLNTIQIALSNVRKHFAGILLGVQSFEQLKSKYGKEEAEAIKTNSFSQVYLPGMSHSQAQELSSLLGKKDHLLENATTRTLPLKTPNELRTMKDDQALILLGNNHPVLAKMSPWYKQYFLKKKTKHKPIKIELSKKGKKKRLTQLLKLEELVLEDE